MSRSRQQAIGIDYRSKLLNPWGFASPGFFISGSVQSLRSKIVARSGAASFRYSARYKITQID